MKNVNAFVLIGLVTINLAWFENHVFPVEVYVRFEARHQFSVSGFGSHGDEVGVKGVDLAGAREQAAESICRINKEPFGCSVSGKIDFFRASQYPSAPYFLNPDPSWCFTEGNLILVS